jgi:hypothetical protein
MGCRDQAVAFDVAVSVARGVVSGDDKARLRQ